MPQPARRPPLLPALMILLLAGACLVVGRFGGGCREARGGETVEQQVVASGGQCRWSVYFSPEGGCTEAIVAAIESAGETVRVQAYSFTSTPIARALLQAHQRGVDVQVILDESQRTEQYSAADFLARSGIPTWIDARPGLAHNKVIVIDGTRVVTGSFNFTKAAETTNRENVLVLEDRLLAAAYAANWERDRQACETYAPNR